MTSNATHPVHGDDYYYDYNYTYEYDPSFAAIPLDELVPVTLVYMLTLLLGIVGNGLVIFSISYYRRMRTVTNVFLLSLASADLLLVLICVPIKAVAFFSFTWTFGEALCKMVNYVQTLSMICSVLTLTVISIERVVAVVFPLRAKYLCTMKHAQVVVLCVWAVSFLLATPTYFIYIHMEVGDARKAYWCVKTDQHDDWLIAYETYMMTLLFVIPLLVMIFAYSVIGIKVWDVSKMRTGGMVLSTSSHGESGRRSLTKGGGDVAGERALLGNGSSSFSAESGRGGNRQNPDERETRKQVVGMLVMVVFLFALCWAPILTNNLMVALGHLHRLHLGYLKPMRQAFLLLSYFNSCLNPIVYAFFSRNFRQSFRMAICACVKGKAFVRAYRYSISVASTRRSVVHANFNGGGGGGFVGGRATMTSVYETGNGSSENDMTRSPTSYSPESLELHKI